MRRGRPAGSGGVIITIRDYAAGSAALRTAVRDGGLAGGSWLPIERVIWKTGDRKTGAEVYRRYGRNGRPVWIIAVTNNIGDFNDTTKEAFRRLLNGDGYPSVGTWTDPETGLVYNDTVLLFSGTRTDAERIKRKYGQKEIVEVREDGDTEFISG